jgi:hypothetical protein
LFLPPFNFFLNVHLHLGLGKTDISAVVSLLSISPINFERSIPQAKQEKGSGVHPIMVGLLPEFKHSGNEKIRTKFADLYAFYLVSLPYENSLC